MKKPDRFEREVAKYEKIPLYAYDSHVMADHEVIKLLRREHAWVVRMVKKVDAWACEQQATSDDVVAAILQQLATRQK